MVKIIMTKTSHTQETQTSAQSIINAANEGCLLHQFYIDELISEPQFQSGLAFAKLYGLAMRSFGIHNRVRTASQSWDQLHGIVYDQFSNQKIEGLWRYILKALDPTYHDNISMRDIAFNLVLTMDYPKRYAINDIQKTLSYLQTIWEKIETSPYRLGLFVYEQQSTSTRLH
jgi:hypothetical protein